MKKYNFKVSEYIIDWEKQIITIIMIVTPGRGITKLVKNTCGEQSFTLVFPV